MLSPGPSTLRLALAFGFHDNLTRGVLSSHFTDEDTGQRKKRLNTKATQLGQGAVVQSLVYLNPKPGFSLFITAKILDTDAWLLNLFLLFGVRPRVLLILWT